jgi:fumarate hydratase class II
VSDVRIETDSLAEVWVPADNLRGSQTQHSLEHFSIAAAEIANLTGQPL